MLDYYENKGGKCMCGCGEDAPIAKRTIPKYGHVKGLPLRYIKSHVFRKSSPARVEILNGEKCFSWKGGKVKSQEGYVLIQKPGHLRANCSGYVSEHILIAEKVMWKSLPPKAVVHHHSGIKDDNENKNLIICENEGYHALLHTRQRAKNACGHTSWRKCWMCKEYDDTSNLYMLPNRDSGYHRECLNKRRREKKGNC